MTTPALAYTPHYATPEQVLQQTRSIGPWTDLYSLGATIYNLLTGLKPPTQVDIDDLGADAFDYSQAMVSDWMKQVISQLMRTRRKERPQSVEDVRRILTAPNAQEMPDERTVVIGKKQKSGLKSEQTVALTDKKGRKSRALIAGLLVAIALATGVVVSLVLNTQNKRHEQPVESTVVESLDTINAPTSDIEEASVWPYTVVDSLDMINAPTSDIEEAAAWPYTVVDSLDMINAPTSDIEEASPPPATSCFPQ